MDGMVGRWGRRDAVAGRVLVVDDDTALRFQVVSALEVTGFQPVQAGDVEGALAAVAANPDIAVVLTDISMPGRSGIALAEDLRVSQHGGRAIEVVLMSGHAGFDEALAAMRAGAFDLLRKPFRLAELASAVSLAMGRASAKRRAARAAELARLEHEALRFAAPTGLGHIGRDLRLTQVNPVLAEMLGVAEGASVATRWAWMAELPQGLEPTLERILAGEAGQPATCLRVELQDRPGARMAGGRVVDLRLYPIPDCEDPSRVEAIGLVCRDAAPERALMREADHRLKNTSAVFLGLAHGAARHARGRDAASLVAELTGRVMALSRAYDLVGPAVGGLPGNAAGEGTMVWTLARAVLAPFDDSGGRIALQGPEVPLGFRATPGLALVLHELATNALKHGALSAPAGWVELAWATDADSLTLGWREEGGPPVTGPPARPGFGLRLLGQPNSGGVRLRTVLDWSSPSGLQASITLALASV